MAGWTGVGSQWRRCRTGDGYPHTADQAAKVVVTDQGVAYAACIYCSWQRRLVSTWYATDFIQQEWEQAHPAVGPVICAACAKPSIYMRDWDRMVHEDGSDNRRCWRMITSGRVPDEVFNERLYTS